MRSVAIQSVQVDEEKGMVIVTKRVVNDEGAIELHGHSFPVGAIGNWARVLELEDHNQVIDCILYEPYLADGESFDDIQDVKERLVEQLEEATLFSLSESVPIQEDPYDLIKRADGMVNRGNRTSSFMDGRNGTG